MKRPYKTSEIDAMKPGQAIMFNVGGVGHNRGHDFVIVALMNQRYLVGCVTCERLYDEAASPDFRLKNHLGVMRWEDDGPPSMVVGRALDVAMSSPCGKSKRGVVIFDTEGSITSIGTNGPPPPFICDGSDACKNDCPKICAHAEQRAVMRNTSSSHVCDVLHVKIARTTPTGWELVAGGPPSCWQCSRMILDAGYRGVWLYELRGVDQTWVYYTALEFHEATLKNCGLHAVRK